MGNSGRRHQGQGQTSGKNQTQEDSVFQTIQANEKNHYRDG